MSDSQYSPLLPGPEPQAKSEGSSSSKLIWWLLGGLVVACVCIGSITGAAIFGLRNFASTSRRVQVTPASAATGRQTSAAPTSAPTPEDGSQLQPTRSPARRATPTPSASAQRLLQEAYALLNAGQSKEALARVDQAIAADATLPGAHWLHGWLNLRFEDDPNQALKDFEQVIKLDPEQSMGYSGRGQTYLALKQFDKALDDLNTAVDKGAKDEWTYTNRAEARLNKLAQPLGISIDEAWLTIDKDGKAEIDAALSDLDAALEANDSFYFALDTRSFIHLKRQEFEKSLADADKMVQIAPKYAQVYNTRSWLYANWGKGDEAVKDCLKGLDLVQGDSAALLDTCGLAYHVSGDYKKALDYYNRALAADPQQIDSVFRRAQTYQKLKNKPQAIADYQQYLKQGKSLELLEACKKALQSLGVKVEG